MKEKMRKCEASMIRKIGNGREKKQIMYDMYLKQTFKLIEKEEEEEGEEQRRKRR